MRYLKRRIRDRTARVVTKPGPKYIWYGKCGLFWVIAVCWSYGYSKNTDVGMDGVTLGAVRMLESTVITNRDQKCITESEIRSCEI